jgi:hypothetical protein
MLKLDREAWNPWPTFSPFGSAATGPRVSTASVGAEPAPGTSIRCQVLCWTRGADGTVELMKLSPPPLHDS